MIPLHLTLQGFLSYLTEESIDFSQVDLACISGDNGAGKSSILDAITFALFGKARKNDATLIHNQADTALVELAFAYEGNVYRIQRTLSRKSSQKVEFSLQTADERWRPLTERSARETNERIERTLRMDYDTFVNAAFFLQGKADQFTRKNPGERKAVLSAILGLEIWEEYRKKARQQVNETDNQIAVLESQLRSVQEELDTATERKQRLQQLNEELEAATDQRKRQLTLVDQLRRAEAARLERQRALESLRKRAGEARLQADRLLGELDQRSAAAAELTQLVVHAEQIQASYQAWQGLQTQLAAMDELAQRYRQLAEQRQAPLLVIENERTRLQTELAGLEKRAAEASRSQAEQERLRAELSRQRGGLLPAEELAAQRNALEEQRSTLNDQAAALKAAIEQYRTHIKEAEEHLAVLAHPGEALCPVCGQPLDEHLREGRVELLQGQKTAAQERQKQAIQQLNTGVTGELREVQNNLERLARTEQGQISVQRSLAQIEAQLEQHTAAWERWQSGDAPQLEAVRTALASDDFAAEARQRLAEIDASLAVLQYDQAAHDALRQQEQAGRASQEELRRLERAQGELSGLQAQIATLQVQGDARQEEARQLEAELSEQAASLAADEAAAGDLRAEEADLLRLETLENKKRMEVGQAAQLVAVLDDLKQQQQSLQGRREELAQRKAQLQTLERSFSRQGAPAMLIEQALPEIEAYADDFLHRLSGGTMSVRFATQVAYKDSKRDDLRETLEIVISDGSGARDYELYSGGEAFRANFAIRLALSRVLAQRAGARLQTLVIDEGFGSQDAQGRQRLIEAINIVRGDFAKILVITHMDELKDAFPNRIEVTKTAQGSQVRVV